MMLFPMTILYLVLSFPFTGFFFTFLRKHGLDDIWSETRMPRYVSVDLEFLIVGATPTKHFINHRLSARNHA